MPKSWNRTLWTSTVAASALFLSACGGGGDGGGSAAADDAPVDVGPADVTIVNFDYEPVEFTATAGEPVAWVNEGAAPHTVTGDGFDSGIIRSGNGWTHTFDEPGTYEFWCTNHEGAMSGSIVVE